MNFYVYLDHNIIDDISKDDFPLKASDKFSLVYSNENFCEIRRSGNELRFLDSLEKIKAQKLELILDSDFRITGSAQISEYKSPHEEYASYLETLSINEFDPKSTLDLITRLHGANNMDAILCLPDSFERNIQQILGPYGLYDDETKTKVKNVKSALISFVNGALQEVGNLESARESFGTHKGRASNLSNQDNPIELLWDIVKMSVNGVTLNQFFGFDPIDKQGYKEWPLFLGIIGCHSMLNFLGFCPDGGLISTRDIPGIQSDASHIGHAAFCHALLSRDQRLIAKAKAIYNYKNISTQILTIAPIR